MPKQEFDFIDYMAPLVVAIIFAVIVFIISFTIINFYCITRKDDLTVFEKVGSRMNLRLGPHSLEAIRRGGYASTYAREHPDEIERKLIANGQ
ncbi:Protein T01C8.2 [Aphelenchoides avenae]|nr:Protein T01C8.2 [Aphelenchus avenae]